MKYTIRVFFHTLFNFRKEYRKQMNLFCDTFHEEGLTPALIFKFGADEKKADKIALMAKKIFGYTENSLAAEEDWRVKKYCFDVFYFKLK